MRELKDAAGFEFPDAYAGYLMCAVQAAMKVPCKSMADQKITKDALCSDLRNRGLSERKVAEISDR
jgi:hypothetical protein